MLASWVEEKESYRQFRIFRDRCVPKLSPGLTIRHRWDIKSQEGFCVKYDRYCILGIGPRPQSLAALPLADCPSASSPEREGPVLDLGCGPGIQARAIADLGNEVVGIDVSEEAVEIARRRVPEGRFFTSDIYALPWAELDHGFDVVLAMEVIEHLYYPRLLFQAARRCLRPGGTFILSTPYHGYAKNLAISILDKWDGHLNALADGWHIKFFSPRTLRDLVEEEGFGDTRFRFGGRVPFFWKSMVCRCRRP
jgi:2-polyprenyl-3-methyl-5-hydroxy-6-metoxy-1,4-benzoquinol methylase